jgi:hypothetical protein
MIRSRFLAACFSLSFLAVSTVRADPTYTVRVFATSSAVSGTSPDSVTFGDGSLWIAYQNGADTAGASGSSTVVRYSPAGAVLNTWTIKGNVDGLNIDPTSGLVWALQNNDGNSGLTVINPITNATTPYSYGNTYTNVANRGFDDLVFSHGNVFISETNPASGADAVIVRLTTGLHSPLQISPILNSTFIGTNLATHLPTSVTIIDSDSLKLTTTGVLALTGEADKKIAFISNPGTASQTETFLSLLGANLLAITGNPDDTVFPNAANGFFYIADTGANTVYRIAATGLAPGSVYIDVGDEFGILDTTTGIVTPIFTGVSPHGADFVPLAQSVPEPSTMSLTLASILLFGVLLIVKLWVDAIRIRPGARF